MLGSLQNYFKKILTTHNNYYQLILTSYEYEF